MREGWKYKTLEDCAEIQYGTRVVQKKDGGTIYPVYGGGGETFRMDTFNREDCLVVARFAMSKCCVRYVTGKFFLNDSGLSVKAGDSLHQDYLNHCILSLNDDIYNLGKGAAQRNLDVKSFKKLKIAIPPLSSQLTIVTELDKINELIRLKKEQLKDYDNLAQSIFYEMFGDPVENEKGWEVKKLGDIGEITSSKRIFAEEYVDSGIPFYRSKEVIEKSKQLPLSVELYISEERYQEVKDAYGVPSVGDILITAVGTIGKIWVVDTDEPFYFKDGNLVWLRNIQDVDSIYFRMSLIHLIDEYKKANANGAAYNALTIAKLKQMDCPLPPLPLQQLFASRITQIEAQKTEVQHAITDLETLLASRMQFWFDINEAADSIVNNYYSEKLIEDRYDEMFPQGHHSMEVNYGERQKCVVNDIDFKLLAQAYNHILDNGANTLENINKVIYPTLDKAHFCVLVELGLIATEDYKTFNIPL